MSVPCQKAKAGNWISVITEVFSWGLGDGLMKHCSEYIKCDEYEDIGLTDQITGMFSSNKKKSACSANSLVKNAARIIGTLTIPVPFFNYGVGNLVGEAAQCLQTIIISESVKKKVNQYELCYGDRSEGHPMPLTDKQIAKILPKMNLWPTAENIVAQYSKLCIKKIGDEDSYRFYSAGDYFDGIFVDQEKGYAYILCAKFFEACPCIFNMQGGKFDDPEYERDDKTNMIKIRPDGSLIHKNDTEKDRAHEEEYKSKYAKHCRLIRFKEVYEQPDDLASIYSDACFDLHGNSKRLANISVGIVQCVEDTARNIFEKPILSTSQNIISGHNSYETYVSDYSFIQQRYNKIQNLLQGRTETTINNKDTPRFLQNEISGILKLLQEIWFYENSTSTISFTCSGSRAIYGGYRTDMHNKYVVLPARYSTENCCSSNKDVHDTCYSDLYDGPETDIQPLISRQQQSIDVSSMFKEINKVDVLMKHIKDLEVKASNAESVKVSISGITLTLFDIFRGKIKVIAIVVLVFWVFLLGWKMINGDYGKISTKEFGLIALKVFLCYMVVFSDVAKNLIFNFAIQTSQGVGMFFNDVMWQFRGQNDNKYNRVCNMKQGSISMPKKIYGEVIEANNVAEKKYACNSWEKKVCNISNGITNCLCYEYKMSCQEGLSSLDCTKYYEDYEGNENKKYCKTGFCLSNGSYDKANIYKTGSYRQADEYMTYKFECPSDTTDYGCAEYKTYFGDKQCIKRICKKFKLSCDKNQKLSCQEYNVLQDGSYGSCVKGICEQEKTTFVLMPPMERPYKIKSYFSVKDMEHRMTYQPYCHKKINDSSTDIIYTNSDPEAEEVYSAMVGSNVFVCKNKEYELDDGFRISEYIRHGIIPKTKEGILVFQSLLPQSMQSYSDDKKVEELIKMPVPTAVATTDSYGLVKEYNFIDDDKASIGFQRAKYRTYIRSLLSYVNKNSAYPKIQEYGYTRDYSHLSFWDSMDCKIIQFISMQGMDGSFTEDINDVIAGATSGDGGKAVSSAMNGMLQLLKFMFMSFPFGILIFILMFGIGAALFMLVARATQQYCICVFHLVLLVYLSPFIFLLWLFDKTKDAIDSWIDDMKSNIFGACIPFISITMFLYIIDWLLFGDANKYASMGLFLPSGEINDNCYEGNLSDAPIACLTKRSLKTFTWVGLFGLNQGVSLYSSDAFKMLGYLVLRCLFAAGVIIAMTSILDKMEEAIYDIIGSKPTMEIKAGFTDSAEKSLKSGLFSGAKAGKFALSSTVGSVGLVGRVGVGAAELLGSFLPDRTREKVKERWENFKDTTTSIPKKAKSRWEKTKRSIRHKFDETFNTSEWQQHQQRLNDIENKYNRMVEQKQQIRDIKIQQINDKAAQQRIDNTNILNSYVNDLNAQNMFNQQQIDSLARQKETELTNQVNRITQENINKVNSEFDNAKNELIRIMDMNKKNENDNF